MYTEPSQHVNTAVRGVRGWPVGQFGRIHGGRRWLLGRLGRVDGLGRRWHSGLLNTRELPHVVAAPGIIIDTPLCIPCNFTCTMDLVLLLFTAVGDYSVCTYRGSNWHMRAISQHIFGLFDLHQQCFCHLLEGSYFSKTRFSSTSWKSSISRKGQRLCETLRHCSFLHLFFQYKIYWLIPVAVDAWKVFETPKILWIVPSFGCKILLGKISEHGVRFPSVTHVTVILICNQLLTRRSVSPWSWNRSLHSVGEAVKSPKKLKELA